MPQTLMLTGDVNLMNVADPKVPFKLVAPMFAKSDFVFSNLECCFYIPPGGHSLENEGFFAEAASAEALKIAGIQAVGIANNVNYGEAAITASTKRLDEIGVPHTGAGANRDAARAPVILEKGGVRIGFLQRTSVYWPTNHEATKGSAGVAIIKGHTAYQLPLHKTRVDIPPCNRPGLPPVILTWADAESLKAFTDDVAALKAKTNFVVASCHWGLHQDVLDYMPQIAHAAIDAGADVVIGHGPHYSLAVESYKGKPIYYGLGSFSFHTGHGGRRHAEWIGMMARITAGRDGVEDARFVFVRHNDANETYLCRLADEATELAHLTKYSGQFGAKLMPDGDEVRIALEG
jgi:poly-gamma-glutamate capsule biosynthesis protein CapA/YwtB (metallophosphatase superfamily)